LLCLNVPGSPWRYLFLFFPTLGVVFLSLFLVFGQGVQQFGENLFTCS
jgi:hypothetical protein